LTAALRLHYSHQTQPSRWANILGLIRKEPDAKTDFAFRHCCVGGARTCRRRLATERTAIGAAAFKALYANKSNAFGKCVSTLAQKNEQERSNSAAQCRAARSADAAAFTAQWGHKNAFGKCVSATAKAAAAARVQATINAAKACSTLRKADAATFNQKYGTSANAFGKCVSANVKHSTS
jgi:hypothetical protein